MGGTDGDRGPDHVTKILDHRAESFGFLSWVYAHRILSHF